MNNINEKSKVDICFETVIEMVGKLFEPTVEKISNIVDYMDRRDYVRTFVELYDLLPEHKKRNVRRIIEQLYKEICRKGFEVITTNRTLAKSDEPFD